MEQTAALYRKQEAERQAKGKVRYRTSLPVAMLSRNEFSVWAVLRQCIGKDLSRITMPVIFNEPLTFLQRVAEYMEYVYLLHTAASLDDPLHRMQYVSAFAISATASNLDRVGKPFNPLLGETFELVREDLGFKLIAEQVSIKASDWFASGSRSLLGHKERDRLDRAMRSTRR
ncbi:Oxysterol-binding protein- protein 1 [Desmophyllum pertusum]|uniref:Oxysterol-binding protein- protein 1 n=1 Tax=Desmophyllum pertusum TaxID=174260 RepID=A0A9X0CJ17_9CNID|nr:Oxysterol-binding protein- protein 1 [Desmophyllum pertusum]